MKKLITMAIAILITACIAAFATGKTPAALPQKQFDYLLPFSKIVVGENIDLKLQESASKIMDVAGNDTDIENVDWKIKNDVLYLGSKKGNLKRKVPVTVNVNHLKEIVIMGQSSVSSEGHLISPGLYVYLEADCKVDIKNTGKIFIVNSDNIGVEVKRLVGNVWVGK